MTRERPSYYPTTMLGTVPWINPTIKKEINTLSIISTNYDYVLPNVLKLLYVLKQKSTSFGRLYQESGFRHKASFLKYLLFCQERGFIEKIPPVDKFQYYKITEKGNKFWELLL